MVPLRCHATKSEGQSESRRSMLGMLPIELERVLCFGSRKLSMVWGPMGVASTVYKDYFKAKVYTIWVHGP